MPLTCRHADAQAADVRVWWNRGVLQDARQTGGAVDGADVTPLAADWMTHDRSVRKKERLT